jgi:NAD(P)-dependent dehydrogenase (short-subunit alcohol dehydrogenase family)
MKLTFPDSDHPILARAIRAWETGDTRAPESTLDAARKELRAWRADHPSDASDAAAQKTVAETIEREFGGLDILFVNAGIAELNPMGNGPKPPSAVTSTLT